MTAKPKLTLEAIKKKDRERETEKKKKKRLSDEDEKYYEAYNALLNYHEGYEVSEDEDSSCCWD